MVPICLILAISVAGILKTVKADKLYAALVLVVLGAVGSAGVVFDLEAELVVFGLLPLSFVSGLGLVRIGQILRGSTASVNEGMPEKA
jgi:hypothetical protein